MAGILSLKPEDESKLHPEALKWFNDQKAEIQFEAPLEELSDGDLNAFLSDDEKREFQSCMEDIKGLADLLEKDFIKPQRERDSLYANNTPILLTTFPKQIITNVLLAMASCLRGMSTGLEDYH